MMESQAIAEWQKNKGGGSEAKKVCVRKISRQFRPPFDKFGFLPEDKIADVGAWVGRSATVDQPPLPTPTPTPWVLKQWPVDSSLWYLTQEGAPSLVSMARLFAFGLQCFPD